MAGYGFFLFSAALDASIRYSAGAVDETNAGRTTSGTEKVRSRVQDLSQCGRERVGVAVLAVFAAQEATVVAGEGDGPHVEPLGNRDRPAVGHLTVRLDPGVHDDAGRHRPLRVEIGLIVGARHHVLPEQRVVARAVVLARQPEHGRVGGGLVSEARRNRTLVADDRDELRHPGSQPTAHVRLVDIPRRGQRRVAVGQHLRGRRLVRHQRPDLLSVPRHQRQHVDGATAAGEDVHRPGVERRDQPVQVVGVPGWRGLGGTVGVFAAFHAPGVVGDDRAVGEVPSVWVVGSVITGLLTAANCHLAVQTPPGHGTHRPASAARRSTRSRRSLHTGVRRPCARHTLRNSHPEINAEEIGLDARAGIHTGEVEVVGSDLRGLAVHLAARVGALAGPREALVSNTVKELGLGSGIGFEDRGTHARAGPDEWRLHPVSTER